MEFTFQPLRCGCCGGPHMSDYCENFLVGEVSPALQDAFVQFMEAHEQHLKNHEQFMRNIEKNKEASLRNLENQPHMSDYCDNFLVEEISPALQDTLFKFMEETTTRLRNLENQVGQLSERITEKTKNSYPNNVVVELMETKQASFDSFEVCCEGLSEQVPQFEQEESEYNFMVELEVKNKNSTTKEDPRVRHGEIHVTAQLLGIEPNHPLQDELELLKDKKRVKHYPEFLATGSWGHLLLYAKFLEFLPTKRKKRDDIFFLSYMPP